MKAIKISRTAWNHIENHKWRLNYPILVAAILIIGVIFLGIHFFIPWLDSVTAYHIEPLRQSCLDRAPAACHTLKLYQVIAEALVDLVCITCFALFEFQTMRNAVYIVTQTPLPPIVSGLKHCRKLVPYTILLFVQSEMISIPHYLNSLLLANQVSHLSLLLVGALSLTLYFGLQILLPVYLVEKQGIFKSVLRSFTLSQQQPGTVIFIGVINFAAIALGAMSLGIAFIWLCPFIHLTVTSLYFELAHLSSGLSDTRHK